MEVHQAGEAHLVRCTIGERGASGRAWQSHPARAAHLAGEAEAGEEGASDRRRRIRRWRRIRQGRRTCQEAQSATEAHLAEQSHPASEAHPTGEAESGEGGASGRGGASDCSFFHGRRDRFGRKCRFAVLDGPVPATVFRPSRPFCRNAVVVLRFWVGRLPPFLHDCRSGCWPCCLGI